MRKHHKMLEVEHEGKHAVFLSSDRGILQRARGRFDRGSIPRYPVKLVSEGISYVFTEKEFRKGIETWKAIHKLPHDEIHSKKNLIMRLSQNRDTSFRLQAAQFAGEWGRESGI